MSSDVVQLLSRLDRGSPQFPKQLFVVLGEEMMRDCMSSLSAWVTDYLDHVRISFRNGLMLISEAGVDCL
jgi:hypothetical protein